MLEATRSFVFLVLLQTKNENERIKVSSISYSPGLFGSSSCENCTFALARPGASWVRMMTSLKSLSSKRKMATPVFEEQTTAPFCESED